MNSQLSYALSAGAALAELRFERSISSEASVKTEGFSLTSTETHGRGRGPPPLRCQGTVNLRSPVSGFTRLQVVVSLCRNGNAADFRPDPECLPPGSSVLGGSEV